MYPPTYVATEYHTNRWGLHISPDILYHLSEMTRTRKDQAIQLIEERGIVRPKELAEHGVSRAMLSRLVTEGLVIRQARGIYVSAGHSLTESYTLAHVAKRVPEAVFCLLTALRFHNLTTQAPAEVWIALAEKARRPRLDYPRLRVSWVTGAARTEGIEEHRVEGVMIRVYSAAKTVADCFKYRNKVGIDVAVEALRDFNKTHRASAEELSHFARVCRVSRVMQPYLDSIV